MGIFSFFSKEKKETLDKGLERTKQGVFSKLARAVAGKSKIDDEILDNLEEVFITSDVGVETTLKIIDRIEKRVAHDKYVNSSELNNLLCEEITDLLAENNNDSTLDDFTVPAGHKPHVIMVVGVNGVGKTTTIGKLAHQFKKAGNKVMLGAADTFRAAAVEQLDIWGERAGVPVIKQKLGADPASVAFDTLQSAKANDIDVVIIDTAGRLHNKKGLMDELTQLNLGAEIPTELYQAIIDIYVYFLNYVPGRKEEKIVPEETEEENEAVEAVETAEVKEEAETGGNSAPEGEPAKAGGGGIAAEIKKSPAQ